MRVQDVMTGGAKTISPTTAAEDAWNMMRLNRIHHLVVTKGKQVVGVLSDRDAGGHRGASIRANNAVADLMTAPAVTVEPTTTVRQAANVMRGRSIGVLSWSSLATSRGSSPSPTCSNSLAVVSIAEPQQASDGR